MNWLTDNRTTSLSAIVEMNVGDYLRIAEKAYDNKGGLKGQREPLKTTSALQIRKRMLADLSKGAVLPPLVIGVVVSEEEYQSLLNYSEEDIAGKLSEKALKTLAIIDGMQRTTALHEAVDLKEDINNFPLRVEWWISKNVESLVYRMMVLNTAQVPWTMARQMSVLYGAMVEDIKEQIGDIAHIMTPEDPGRRTRAGEYSSDTLVDLYLSFSKRKTKVDAKQEVSEKFARLDLVQNVADEKFQSTYYEVLRQMAALDHEISRNNDETLSRFASGKNVFGTHPARIGFIVAAGQMVLGRAGIELDPDRHESQLAVFKEGMDRLIEKMEAMSDEQLSDFLQLATLEEILNQRSGKVGEYERAVFFEAFKVLFEDFDTLPNLAPCWRAH